MFVRVEFHATVHVAQLVLLRNNHRHCCWQLSVMMMSRWLARWQRWTWGTQQGWRRCSWPNHRCCTCWGLTKAPSPAATSRLMLSSSTKVMASFCVALDFSGLYTWVKVSQCLYSGTLAEGPIRWESTPLLGKKNPCLLELFLHPW